MFKLKKIAVAAAVAAVLPAFAQDFTVLALSFEGLAVNSETVLIDQFYNGGTSKDLVTNDPVKTGPAYGVVFGPAAQAIYSGPVGDGPWTRRWAVGTTPGDPATAIPDVGDGALFIDDVNLTLNVPAGFNTAFSLWYTGKGNQGLSSVKVYSEVDGTGTEVGSFGLNATAACSADLGQACLWAVGSTGLSSTGRSVVFTLGGAEGTVFFDNITFGAAAPTDTTIAIPEPGTYGLMALGLLAVGGMARRRRG